MPSFLAFGAAALAEIAGRFAFRAWLRLGRSAWWPLPGLARLALFAVLLTRAESAAAGRAYAACGGICVAAALLWLWAVEAVRPDRWDLLGAAVILGGAAIILFGPRPAWAAGQTCGRAAHPPWSRATLEGSSLRCVVSSRPSPPR
ncbi:YnfA family protein [Caldovatus aquaticus]|uniref:Uncharacterized protein n=1 Tax=Caldovatus aquaticus TaxID=2865671 RepID=A0ABS7F0Q6_9PROT|nr:hypothetical protein [Caldovatus aquaticus]